MKVLSLISDSSSSTSSGRQSGRVAMAGAYDVGMIQGSIKFFPQFVYRSICIGVALEVRYVAGAWAICPTAASIWLIEVGS